MKAFHNAYAALINEVSADDLNSLETLVGLFKPYEDGHIIDARKNAFRAYVSEDVLAILIATRFGNIIIHQKYPGNDSLIVVRSSSKLKSLLMIGQKDILSSEQILRLVGGNPNAINSEHFFCEPNASWFIDAFYDAQGTNNITLDVGKRYVDAAGNIVNITSIKENNDPTLFVSSESEWYFADGRHYDGGEAISPLSVLDIILEI